MSLLTSRIDPKKTKVYHGKRDLTRIALWTNLLVLFTGIQFIDAIPPWAGYEVLLAPFLGAVGTSFFVLSVAEQTLKRKKLNRSDVLSLLVILLISLMNYVIDFAILFKCFGLRSGETSVRDTVSFLYFSVMTWTTVGYGDITPIGGSRVVAALEALTGQLVFGLTIGLFGVLIRTLVFPAHEKSSIDRSALGTQPYKYRRVKIAKRRVKRRA